MECTDWRRIKLYLFFIFLNNENEMMSEVYEYANHRNTCTAGIILLITPNFNLIIKLFKIYVGSCLYFSNTQLKIL